MTTLPRKKVATVIATRNRPSWLSVTLQSLLAQTLQSSTLIVVDSSDPEMFPEVQKTCDAAGMDITLIHVDSQSLTAQRNLAVSIPGILNSHEFIQVLDDDTFPSMNYTSLLVDFLGENPQAIGVSGLTDPRWQAQPLPAPVLWLYLRSGYWADRPGCISKAGFARPIEDVDKGAQQTQWLIGCSTWRSELFTSELYNQSFQGSALFEDVEFSLRAQRYGQLWVLPNALLKHPMADDERASPRIEGFRLMRNRWEVVRGLRNGGTRRHFWLASATVVLANMYRSVLRPRNRQQLKRELDRTRGMVLGALAVVAKRPPR